jgi:hypothetical protein
MLAILALSRAFSPRQPLSQVNVNYHDYSSSEQEVLKDFSDWVLQLNEQSGRTKNGAFVYSNLNEGITLVFIGWEGYEDYCVEPISGSYTTIRDEKSWI